MHHYGQAVELARAAGDSRPEAERELVRYLLLAGERASHLDTEAAETYLRRAVALSEHDELARARALAKLAPVLGQRRDVHESIETAEAAIPVLRAQDPTAAAQLLNYLATSSWSLGEMERARDFGLDAIGLLEDDPGPALVSAYGSVVEQAYALLGLGRCGDAKALRDGQAIFDRLGARPVAAARAA